MCWRALEELCHKTESELQLVVGVQPSGSEQSADLLASQWEACYATEVRPLH